MTSRLAIGAVGGVVGLVLAGGVAAAVTDHHHDAAVALPAVCRDNPGGTGGALPGGTQQQNSLSQQAGSGSTGGGIAKLKLLVGNGTTAELNQRLQALEGGGGSSAAGAGGSGTSGASGGAGTGNGSGTGNGNGSGSGGTGGAAGQLQGPGGGSGPNQVPGLGSDPSGVQQAPQPLISPQTVPPPQQPPAAKSHSGMASLIVFVILLLAAAAVGAWLLLRRRTPAEQVLPDGTGLAPSEADAFAERALSQGDLDLALRWTFVAGLLRLDEVGVLKYDPARTTSECGRWVRSRRFPLLANGFDLVAYGGRHATVQDVLDARAGWEALIAEVRPVRTAAPA